MRSTLCAVLCVACGGGQTQESLAGWTATGAVSNISPHDTCSDSKGYDVLWLTLSSHFTSPFKATAANDCTVKASSTDLGIALIAMNASQPHTFTAGSYPIDLQGVTAFTLKYDVRCAHHFPNALPSSGTVTLTAVDSTHVTGSYDLTFPGTTGGRIQGTFDAPRGTLPFNACDGLGIGGGTSGPGCSSVTCQP